MPTVFEIEKFLELGKQYTMFDVRTPAEFEKGHIPGAINLPLFTNEERVVVGKLYKQVGRQPAILKGLEIVGPKLKEIIKNVSKTTTENTILVHCWRGGMRSGSVSWLLEMYGFKVYTLKKGYKAYRNFVLQQFEKKLKLTVLGGYTGTKKTEILQKLKNKGEQVIDLEKLAHHKGSSFGAIGEDLPPTQEQFENNLAGEIVQINVDKNCWIEDESRTIGKMKIADKLWDQMRNTNVAFLDVPFDKRVENLLEQYGKYNREELIAATERITKRLGGQHAKRAVEAIREGDLKTACEINLAYYDKAYLFGLSARDKKMVDTIKVTEFVPGILAEQLLKWKK